MTRSAFEEWERALCRYFLSAAGDDAGPIRSFEVTPATLADCRPGRHVDDADAVRSFRAALHPDEVCSAMEHGRYRRLDEIGLPGCFSYLALTLFVDSEDSLIGDATEHDGAFRAKLANFLGVNRAFSNLTGVAQMWRELRRWLEARAANGEPYGRLILPDPGAWTHIGYTAYLSFPSRRDKSLMRRFLDDNPDQTLSAAAFLSKFRNEAASPKASLGLKQAFDEFHEEFLAGRRTLADHRFWSFVQAIARGRSTVARPIQLSVEISRDQDESWIVALVTSESEQTDREHFDDLGTAAAKALDLGPHELKGSLNRGFLVFRQIGNAMWRAAPDLSECVGRVMVGLSPGVAHRAGSHLGDLDAIGSWFLTRGPVPVGAAEKAAIHLGLSIASSDYIVPVTVSNGVRTGPFWLGRSPFLPQIDADDAELSVRAEKEAIGTIRCLATERTPGMFRLVAEGPVEGNYVISPTAEDGVAGAWCRRVRFVADALVHETSELSAPADPLIEWSGLLVPAPVVQDFEPQWDERRSPIDDLVEATYAGGRAGWNEMDIVSLARAGLGDRLNPWDVVRSLQEATCLRPMLRAQWRGRVWALRTPTLGTFRSRTRSVVVVDGCIGARLADDFRRAVTAAGGVPFRRPGVTALAPSLFGCVNADAGRLAESLRWPLRTETFRTGGKLAFRQTERRPDRYGRSHRWSWKDGRFIKAFTSAADPVVLERWVHPGGRDHDLYTVANGSRTWHLLARNAAVVLAHCLAERPLFAWSSGILRRIGHEGALPDGLAAASRIRHLANSGPVEGGYVYGLDDQTLLQVNVALPNLVPLLRDSASKQSAEVVSSVLHSGGRVRGMWNKGSLSTTHS
jgi:hypothetical protein